MTLLRFSDLKVRGIVVSRVTLSRWIKGNGFPKPIRLGANSVAWDEKEVEQWLAMRRSNQKAA